MTDYQIRTLFNEDCQEVYGFQTIFNYHDHYQAILFFPVNDTEWAKIADEYILGAIGTDGSVAVDSNSYVVTANVKAGSVVVFNMPSVALSDNCMFLVDSTNVTDEYMTLCRLPYYQDRPCLNCAVILTDCIIRYSMPKSQFDNGEGIYLLKETDANIKNILAITRDGISGNLLGIVSKNTNIDSVTLNDVVEIYSTITTDYDGQ